MEKKRLRVTALLVSLGWLVLAASFAWALPGPEEKSLKHPKMTSSVLGLAEAASPDQAMERAKSLSVEMEEGRVRLTLETAVPVTEDFLERLRFMGLLVEAVYGNWIQVLCYPSILHDVANLPEIQYVRKPIYDTHRGIITEGAAVMDVPWWHSMGYTGRYVKVAVLDIGFKGYRDLLGTELPWDVTAQNFSYRGFESTVHGTACAEIVHDLAPASSLLLVSYATLTEKGQAVDWIISQGAHIISASTGSSNETAGDGTGMSCDIVEKAFQNHVLWVNAGGNEADEWWIGPFNDPDGDGWHNFQGQWEGNYLDVSQGDEILVKLTWNDWPVSAQDYDLYLDDKNGQTVAKSENEQSGTQRPYESISYTAAYTGRYFVYVKKYDASGTETLRLWFGGMTPGYTTPAYEISEPGDSPYALAVGALHPQTYARKAYSSRGPTTDGRPKPDLAAPAGIQTRSYGPKAFEGTSAACPHVAGAAALLKEALPSFPPRLLTTFLMSRAHALGSFFPNTEYGYGLARLGWPSMNERPFGQVYLNRGDYRTGQEMVLSIGVLPGVYPTSANVYAVVLFPDQVNYLEFKAEQWPIQPFAGDLMRYRFSGLEQTGDYLFGIILTWPYGTLWDASSWIDFRVLSFTVAP